MTLRQGLTESTNLVAAGLMVEMDKFDLINEDIESLKIKVYEKIKTQEAAFLKQNIEKFDIEQKHIAKEKRANAEMLNDNIAKFELEELKSDLGCSEAF